MEVVFKIRLCLNYSTIRMERERICIHKNTKILKYTVKLKNEFFIPNVLVILTFLLFSFWMKMYLVNLLC